MTSPLEPYGLHIAEPGETLVVGLGNPILGDDGVGWRVIDELDELDHEGASLQQACVGGVSLMELLVGYRRAIIVDAIIDPEVAPGSVCAGHCRMWRLGWPVIWTRHTTPPCRPPSKQDARWAWTCRLTSRSWASSSNEAMSSANN